MPYKRFFLNFRGQTPAKTEFFLKFLHCDRAYGAWER